MIEAQRLLDADEVLFSLKECLVIGYEYNDEHKSLVLVSEFPLRPGGGDRSFVALQFDGVAEFERLRGVREQLQRFETHYSIDGNPPVVVQSIALCDAPRRGIELWFGPAFGGVRFTFVSVRAGLRET